MKYYFLCWLFCIGLSSYGQDRATIEGTVHNSNAQPVANAQINLLNSQYETFTGTGGKFHLEGIPTGTYTLNVRKEGYAEYTRRISIGSQDTVLQITLSSETEKLGEVVITAQKRQELVQEIPLSITSLSYSAVQEGRIQSANDLTAITPNLYATDPGDQRSVVSIRGIVTTSYDPAIATYIDGVNQFGLDINMPQLFDVQRIEVLRGPQGTLYGRNAMGGVINIITRQPDRETSIFGEATVGNYGRQEISIGFKIPLIANRLYLGAVGLYRKMDGFYTNEFSGEKYDEQQGLYGNYYLRYLINPAWNATLNFKHADLRNKGPFPLVMSIDEALENPFRLNQNQNTELFDHSFNASLVIDHKGENINFNSQSSYQQNYHYYEQPIDADFSPLEAISIFNNYGRDWNNLKVVTQEFRLFSPAGGDDTFSWTAGTFLFHSSNPVRQATGFGEDAALMGSEDINFSLINTSEATNSGAAIFGQGTYKFTKAFALTAGLRYDYEYREQSIHGEYRPFSQDESSFEFQQDSTATVDFSALSPMAGITYTFSEDHMGFLSYRKGFRTGGFTPLTSDPSQPPLYPFQPEHSNNFEIGIKNSFWNHKVLLNATVFYTEVTDVQVPTLVLPDAVTLTRNTGKMISKGGELEIRALLFNGLKMSYDLGITDAAYESLELSQGGNIVNFGENRQIFTPDITSMLTLQYERQLGKEEHTHLFLRGEWKHIGAHYFDLANTLRQSPYDLFNSQFGISYKDWKITLWGRNLLDKRYISYGFDFGAVRLGNPSTFGLTLSYKK